jgi:hypothetical protein
MAPTRTSPFVADKLPASRVCGWLQHATCAGGSEHRRPRAFSFAAPVSPVCFEATILKFLQHEQHFSLVACFTQFVHDRLRCNKSWFAATKEQRASAAEKNRWSDALRRHGQRVMRTP